MYQAKSRALNVLSKELDVIEIKEAKVFIESQLKSDTFLSQLNFSINKMKGDTKNAEKNKLIVILALLGLGRNRTIKALQNYNVTRRDFEKIRDMAELGESDLRAENEKQITEFRWKSKVRKKRLKYFEKTNWEEIKERYKEGESISSLAKEHKLSSYIITEQLKDEGFFEETRSTITKKMIAEKKINKIPNAFFVKLVENNPLDSKELLWEKAKTTYPWLLRRQMYDKMDKLSLSRSEDEVNIIRAIKSKTETNDAYLVKVNGYKAVKDVFGSVDNLVEKYMKNTLGSYNKIADKINKENSFDHEITARQVSKIVTNHSMYERKASSGQKQLYTFIKKAFPKFEVVEEYVWSDTNKRVDVYVPDLKVGFDFNGDYWHRDVVIEYNYGETAYEFHKKRVKDLSKMGIKLVYVWESDWNNNYKEIEDNIVNKNWNAQIFNKYENKVFRSGNYKAPDRVPSLLRSQITRFLKEKNIKYTKENNSHLVKLEDYNIIINVPNYSSLSNKKECLNLQKKYEKKNIELLTFLPWGNIYKIKQFLSYRLKLDNIEKVAARKCKIVLNKGITKEQKAFFEKNHLLGYNNFRHIDKTITLTYNDKPLIAALFTRKPKSNKAELKRLVSEYGVSVQGGASRLIREYIRQTPDVQEIHTFSDCDLGFGSVYRVLGFKETERSKEQLTWYNERLKMKFSNLSLIQVGADRLLRRLPNYEPVGIGENLPTNQEIVQAYNFAPVYDSGYRRWVLKTHRQIGKHKGDNK